MPPEPDPGSPGREEDPAWADADVPEEDVAAGWDGELDAIIAETDELAAEEAGQRARAARLGFAVPPGLLGRRGPGQPGSAESFPGLFSGPGAGFAAGQVLDSAPGGPELAAFADAAAGDEDDFAGVSDDELTGVLCAWERVAAHAAARRYAALAELMRRRPRNAATPVEQPGRLPAETDEFLPAEVGDALAWSRAAATEQLETAWALTARLHRSRQALRDGVIDDRRARLIAELTAGLTADQAARVEALVVGRAGRLTMGGLRAALRRAIIEVDPDAARRRREDAEQGARVECRPEFSGNASLSGRELPPAAALAADQRVTWWARQLRAAGLKETMGRLRVRAFLDLLLGTDSRPGQPRRQGAPAGPADGPVPPGLAGQVNLTVPLATLLGLGERPAELGGFGAVDPALARELAQAAALSQQTRWCVTVTDDDGHAVGHGCARLAGTARDLPHPSGFAGPGWSGRAPGPGRPSPASFGFAAVARSGAPVREAPGGYGTWRLEVPGRGSLLVRLEPLAAGSCDHRFQAGGHDPGALLRHLTEIRHATCTGPMCRRPAAACDFEHNIPYQAGGRTCLCNTGPKCRYEHRRKQDPRWRVEQVTPATFRWIAPSGRRYDAEPTRHPI